MEEENVININEAPIFNVKKPVVKDSFSPDDGARGMLFFLIFQVLLVACYYAFAIFGIMTNFLATIVNYLLEMGFVLVVIFVAKRSNVNVINALKIKTKFSWWYVPLCLAVSLICLFGLSQVTDLFMTFMYSIGYQSVVSDVTITTFWNYIYNVVFVAIIPAICEETLFRGLIYQSLNKVNRWLAIFGSSFLFMLIHGSPDQTVHQFILAIILAFSFEATGSLIVPILIHFFNNFIALTYTYIASSTSSGSADAASSSGNVSIFTYIIFVAVTAALSVVLIALIIKLFRKISGKKIEGKIAASDLGSDKPVEAVILDSDNNVISESEVKKNVDEIIDINNKLSSTAKIMYIASILFMFYDWITACLHGFGVV